SGEYAQIRRAVVLGGRWVLRPLVLNILDIVGEAVTSCHSRIGLLPFGIAALGALVVFVTECRCATCRLHPRLAFWARVERVRGGEDFRLLAVPGQRDIARRRAPMLRMIEI